MPAEVRGLKDRREFDEAVEVVARCFEEGADGVRQRFTRFAEYRPESTRVVCVTGRIVSVVHVHHLHIHGGAGAQWRMGGVADVCTLPEHRRRGYARLALQDAIWYMEGEGFDLSMLICTGPRALYEDLGWQSCPNERLFIRVGDLEIPAPADGYQIREVNWDTDLPVLHRLYTAFNQERIGPLVRTPSYWAEKIRPVDTLLAYLAEGGGEPVAYLLGQAVFLNVLEVPHLPGEEGAARELVFQVLRRAQQENLERLMVYANEAPVARAMCQELSTEAVEHSEYRVLMLRAIQPGFPVGFDLQEVAYYFTDYF